MTDVVPVTRKESLKYEIFEILYMQNVISANPGIPAIVVSDQGIRDESPCSPKT